ncbi:MAG: hypothetical protein IKZ53_07240 [Selenomonadaceae bacterium]|nr:hypothetical protein [Selenomonadaceae bacterium]
MNLNQLAKKLFPAFIERAENLKPCRIFLSASDMKTRAVTRHAVADNPADAWTFALEKLKEALGSNKPTILRADWVIEIQSATWEEFLNLIGKTRRNYFRQGIALDSEFKLAFTECELNGNAMLYKESSAKCFFRQDLSNKYCKIRFGCDFPNMEPTSPVVIFTTAGAFFSEDEKTPLPIISKGLAAGHREISHTDSDVMLKLARSGARYLASQVQKNGKFIYGHWPCFDKNVPKYNTLRHFSSAFAMLDVYATYKMGEMKIGSAINKVLKHGVENFIKYRTLPDGSEAAYLVETDAKEIKLGGLGLTLISLVKHSELMKTKKYYPLMNCVARAILTMQKPDGSFVHVLNSEDFSVKEEFRIVYYDGEAIFGMMRLYSITHEEFLLNASEKAFKKFIASNHWKNHDHWLSYATNEFNIYRPKREYFEFGINNFLAFLPFIYHRDTQFPTLLELMMAADSMLERMKTMPEMADLLAKVPLEDFYAAMEARAKNLMNGFFYPELAMFFKRPESVAGSFFIRHHAFRARIDDVEHFLSGFVAYRRYLARRDHDPQPSEALLNAKAEGTGLVNIQVGK